MKVSKNHLRNPRKNIHNRQLSLLRRAERSFQQIQSDLWYCLLWAAFCLLFSAFSPCILFILCIRHLQKPDFQRSFFFSPRLLENLEWVGKSWGRSLQSFLSFLQRAPRPPQALCSAGAAFTAAWLSLGCCLLLHHSICPNVPFSKW